MSDFFAMGGYAGYVWPAYAISVGAIGVLIWRSFADLRKARHLLATLDAPRSGDAA